jgi:hypothetical protein
MMKKRCIFFAMVILAGGTVWAEGEGVRLGLKGSLFSSENGVFRDIYGGAPKVGLECAVPVVGAVSLWAGLDLVRQTGEMTVTREETKVQIVPLTVGAGYSLPVGTKLRFDARAGFQEIFFRETSPVATVKKNGLGLVLGGAGMYRLSERLGLGAFFAWSTCKMSHDGVDFKVGGFDAGGEIEVRF